METISTPWLTDAARSHGERTALRDAAGTALSYAELHERARRLAGPLIAATPDRGLVLLELEPGIEHAVAIHAAILAGRAFQTLRPGLPARERDAALGAGGPALVIDRPWLGRSPTGEVDADAAAGPIDAGSTLSRVLTSGTGGGPRAVDLSYANHRAAAAASAANLGIEDDDVWLCCLPVDHVGGLAILIRSLLNRTAALVHERFDPDRVVAALDGEATLVSLVPTQLRRLLDRGADLSGPRAVLLGGAPAPEELLAEAEERGARLAPTYGLTEACSQVSTLAVADAVRKRGSVGRPLPGIDVRIGDGEVLIRGANVARGALAADGWLHTGDRGRLDEEGFLWVEGRIDDLIVSGGENVRPEEVEAVLAGHPAVREAAVFGRHDPEWGQAVTAAVVLWAGAAPGPEELLAHCRDRLAPFKVPKSIERVDALPRTASGKLQRRRLS